MSAGRASLLALIAVRFLRGGRSRLMEGTARSAFLGTTIGVAAMVVAMALMTGYREDLQHKLTQGNAAVLIYPLSEARLGEGSDALERLDGLAHVAEVRRVTYGQGALASRGHPDAIGVSLRGIDWSRDLRLQGLGEIEYRNASAASGSRAGLTDIIVGRDLAERLAVGDSEVLRLMVLGVQGDRPRFAYESVRLIGTFRSGFSEFDRKLVVLDRRRVEALAGAGVGESVLEVIVSDLGRTAEVAAAADRAVGPDHLVVDWRELNRELFTALRIQQIALFLVLGLIVLVSTFNVASNLVVLVRERMRDVGVLAALGLGPGSLRNLFLLYGGGLTVVGMASGVALGWLVSWALTRFELIRFEGDLAAIYFISSIPFRVRPMDVVAVVGFTSLVTGLACWFPARRGARVRPAVALRYE
ncbi:MAG: ABC transporter permease [Thermoanaerobaculia bacterium]